MGRRKAIGSLTRISWLAAVVGLIVAGPVPAQLQIDDPVPEPDTVIEATSDRATDEQIRERIAGIFAELDSLSDVVVDVRAGVVTLSGQAANETNAQTAVRIASRAEGVVTVEDEIERTLDVRDNVRPIMEELRGGAAQFLRALPLALVAIVVFALIVLLGNSLAKWNAVWRRVAPNPFLAELMSQAVRVVSILIGLIVALGLVGANALVGAILGGAGVLGIAIGFAVRDTLENYISSIMLSIRQPFRANDHVVIGDHEGLVVRLTSRATILMTLDGNHLRIPNSSVFKSVILNYTRTPQRRFDFELGIDANDDPVVAMKVGLDALTGLDFVLQDPGPNAILSEVGDSNIVIRFMAWVDQAATDFGRGRSLAIGAAKDALEKNGFTLPEPIYRIRFDNGIPATLEQIRPEPAPSTGVAREIGTVDAGPAAEILDVTPDTHIEQKVDEERAQLGDSDLLDEKRPVE